MARQRSADHGEARSEQLLEGCGNAVVGPIDVRPGSAVAPLSGTVSFRVN